MRLGWEEVEGAGLSHSFFILVVCSGRWSATLSPPKTKDNVVMLRTGVFLPEDEHQRAQEENGHDLAKGHDILVAVHVP